MSADLPGDAGPPDADLVDDLWPDEPGLDILVGLLTSGPTPDELAGESAAREMYRASQGSATAVPELPDPEPTVITWAPRRRRRLAAAVTVAVAAGIIAAAYSQMLPAPLQNAAYRVLGVVGVPKAQHPSRVPAGPRPTRPGTASQAATGRAGRRNISPHSVSSGSASAAGPFSLSVIAASHRIVAGRNAVLIARLDSRGKPVPGVQLTVLERIPGQSAWLTAGNATTAANGRAVVTVAALTTNAVFRLSGPHGARSRLVLVIVLPAVSVSVTSGPTAAVLTASSPLADPGDVAVLQIRSEGLWVSLRERDLNNHEQVAFMVAPKGRARVYRVVLRSTATHGLSVSNTVTVASMFAFRHINRQNIQGGAASNVCNPPPQTPPTPDKTVSATPVPTASGSSQPPAGSRCKTTARRR